MDNLRKRCGADAPQSADTSPSTAVTASAPTASAIPTPSPATNVPCTAQDTSTDTLTAFGATFASWSTHHQADPGRPDFFLPYLNDGLDRYTRVVCTQGGRVVGYHLNFTPLISLSEGKRAFRGELPPDAILVYDTVASGCEHIQYRSAALAHAFRDADPDGAADAAIILSANPDQQAAVGTIFIDASVRLNVTPTGC
jgi:hypothetical protein